MRTPSTADPAAVTSPRGGRRDQTPGIPDHRLLRRVGQGSYGEVWLAQNIMGTYRAVKVVYRHDFEDERPFEREFKGIQRFEPISRLHDSQVDILHVGRNQDCFYYVMEVADDQRSGQQIDPASYTPRTLASELKEKGRLPFEECVRIGLSLTTALAHLHQHGLIHRDIKPPNVIFVDGVPKLADIGLVTEMEATRSFVGTEGFIPPEGPGTAQADLYSLGKVLYEMATGRDRRDFPELPTMLRESVEKERLIELNEVVLRACELDPKNRYASAQQMHADLALLQTGKSLKEHRRLERRRRLASRVTLATAVVGLLAGVACYEAQQVANSATNRLVQMNVANGLGLMKGDDTLGSLPWFAKAVELGRGQPPADGINRLRLASILDQSPRLYQMFFHGGLVNDAEFSPDGQRLVTASFDRTARIWDVMTGEPVCPPLAHRDEVYCAQFSPDGRWVVTASRDHTARVWDAGNGQPVSPLLRHEAEVAHAAFSPDGQRVITASWDHTSRLWDARTGRPIGPALRHQANVSWAAFSPDGQQLVTASEDHTARLWKTGDGQPIGPPLAHEAMVRVAIFSPDGQRVGTASDDRTARLWDAATGRPLSGPFRHGEGVVSLAFSPDNALFATASKDHSAQVWGAHTGEPRARRLVHENMVRHVAFSPDSRWLITASSDHSARIWDARTGEPVTVPLKHSAGVVTAGFSPDGQSVVTTGHDRTVRVWDLGARPLGGCFLPKRQGVVCTDFSPDAHWLAGFNYPDRTLTVWEIEGGQTWRLRPEPRFTVPWQIAGCPHVFFSPAHEPWLLYTEGTEAKSLNLRTGGPMVPPLSHRDPTGAPVGLHQACFSPDGQRIATTSDDHRARVWEAATGRPLTPWLVHSGQVYAVAFSPDGRWLATGCGELESKTNGYAQVWDATTGQPLLRPLPHAAAVVLVSFSPDGRCILTGCDDFSSEAMAAQVWDARTGRPVGRPLKHGDGISAARYSSDGRRIVTASEDATARVWDARTGEPLTPPLEHPHQVQDAAFSPDGRLVATACLDGALRLWDAATGQPVTPPFGHIGGGEHPHFKVAFSPDGRRIFSASGQASVNTINPQGRATSSSTGPAAGIWSLTPSSLRADELNSLGEILTGNRLDQTGAAVPVESPALEQIWHATRARHPELFTTSTEQLLAWHRLQAADCERDRLWFAARFHLDRLLALQPGNQALRQRRAAAEEQLRQTSAAPKSAK